jgi:hypothetical protein
VEVRADKCEDGGEETREGERVVERESLLIVVGAGVAVKREIEALAPITVGAPGVSSLMLRSKEARSSSVSWSRRDPEPEACGGRGVKEDGRPGYCCIGASWGFVERRPEAIDEIYEVTKNVYRVLKYCYGRARPAKSDFLGRAEGRKQ